jgi:hypothetical protein
MEGLLPLGNLCLAEEMLLSLLHRPKTSEHFVQEEPLLHADVSRFIYVSLDEPALLLG